MNIRSDLQAFPIGKISDAWKNRTLRPNEEYQRGVSWSTNQKKLLIDSILRGYPLPRFYLHQKEARTLTGDPNITFDVIDGQQRIVAIAEFTADNWNLFDMSDGDKIPLPKSIRNLPCPWSGRTFSQLDEGLRSKFLDTEVPVVIITDIETPDEIRDLFIRLQAGTALTRQQVRDAWPGTLGPYVVHLAGKLNSRPQFKCFAVVDKRGSGRDEPEDLVDAYLDDRQTCAQLLTLFMAREEGGEIVSVSSQNLDHLYHSKVDFDPGDRHAQRFERLLRWCDDVFTQHAGRKVRKNLLFSVFLLLEDLEANPSVTIDRDFLIALADRALQDHRDVSAPPPGRVSTAATISRHYRWFVEQQLKGLIIKGLDAQRLFNDEQKAEIWRKYDGLCGKCGAPLQKGSEEYDHIVPWIRGGPTSVENGRPVHAGCHERGSGVGRNAIETVVKP